MEEKSRIDLTMSGVGTASGGEYQHVTIQGVAKVIGDLACANCNIEGVATLLGGVEAQSIQIKGKVDVQGNLSGETIQLEGQIKIAGKCDAEYFTSHGALKVSGFLNSENVTIKLYGPSRVSEIGAGIIRVEKEAGRSILSRFKTLSAETIEGDEIYLEYTKANIVRGNRVFIGVGCHIDLVEYRTEFEQHKQAQITMKRQL